MNSPILGRPAYRYVQRFAVQSGQIPVSVPAATVATQFAGAAVFVPGRATAQPLTQKQAIKLVTFSAIVGDAAQSGKLTALGATVQLSANVSDKALRQYAPSFAPVLLGNTGLRWSMFDDELIYGSDYVEIIPAPDAGLFPLP